MKAQIEIKKSFQTWLDRFNNKCHPVLIEHKGFLPPDEKFGITRPGQSALPNQHIPYVIQQVELEIFSLVDVLLAELNSFNNSVEIGMGDFGGTHALWRLIFDKVTTLEIAPQTINKFKRNNPEFNDGRSTIVNGSSFDINNVAKVPKEIDFLFIDGAHEYGAVYRDFSNYFKSVKKNGIIAFHDTKNEKYGVHKFTRELKNGNLGLQVNIKDIWFSEEIGISYFKV
jgi:hypothetical protein